MIAARPLGARAGLVGSLSGAAALAAVFLLGPSCMPGGNNLPYDESAAGTSSGSGSQLQSGSGGSGGNSAAGNRPTAGNSPGGDPNGGGGVPPAGGFGGGASGSGDFPVGGQPPLMGTGGFVPGGMPNVGGTCNMQVVDPSTLPPCATCMGGRCVNPADYPQAPASLLAPCDQGAVCLPDPLVATKGNVALKPCASVSKSEGRCTSLCIPVTANLAGVLPQDVCAPTDRCAPCYNPVDGTPTGVCKIGCDPGPTTPPFVFPQCCSGKGRCVPRGDIPATPARDNLVAETCKGGNDPVCVPTASINDPTYKYPPCTTQIIVDPGKPGVCVPGCFVNSNPLAAVLKADNCADKTDKCVPCTNPSTGQPSGACSP